MKLSKTNELKYDRAKKYVVDLTRTEYNMTLDDTACVVPKHNDDVVMIISFEKLYDDSKDIKIRVVYKKILELLG